MKKKRRLQLSCCCSVLRMEKKDKSDVCDLDKLCTRKFIINVLFSLCPFCGMAMQYCGYAQLLSYLWFFISGIGNNA